MRTILVKFLTITIFILCAIPTGSHAQPSSGAGGLSVKVSPGVVTFYGDMSNNTLNPFDKLKNGAKFGFGIGVIKTFGPAFGIQAQFMAGSLYSVLGATESPDRNYFSGSVNDFSLSARLDPLKLIKDRTIRFSPYISAGVSTIGYRSVHRDFATNLVLLPTFGYKADGITKAPRVTAMAIPVALGLSFELSPNIAIEIEHSLRFTNTDLLDCVKGETDINDKYGLTSLGFRYTFAPPKSSSAQSKQPKEKPEKTKTVKKIGKETGKETVRKTETQNAVQPVTKNYPQTDIFIDCEIPPSIVTNKVFEVNIRINKDGYRGPAKLIQNYPEGFTALESMEANCIFSFASQSVVVEWDQMPADSIVTYRYHIRAGENVFGDQTIASRFEYEQPDGSRTIRFNKLITVQNRLETQMDKKVEQLIGQDEQGNLKKTGDEHAVDTDIDRLLRQYGDTKNEPVKSGAGIIKPAKSLQGIEFRIQCGAFKEKIPTVQKIAATYKITDVVQEEIHNGWYKYTVGSFRNYNDAVRYKEDFIKRTGMTTAFIVAYRDGVRLANISQAIK